MNAKGLGVAIGLTVLFFLAMNALAYADGLGEIPCPVPSTSCKIVVMTDQEIQSLTGPGLIFDSAVWANRANLSDAINAWKQKIANAPSGVVAKPAPSADKPKETPAPAAKK